VQVYKTQRAVFSFLSVGNFKSLVLLALTSSFRVTQLLKYLIPLKVFFDLNENGKLSDNSITLLVVLVISLCLEISYQLLNQSLRYQIALKYLEERPSEARLTVLSFVRSSCEYTVSTFAILSSICVLGYLSLITAMTFTFVFSLAQYLLLVKFKICEHSQRFSRLSDVREVLIASYSALSMTATTLVYFYDWWHVANLHNFILGFLLLRFMVNTSVSFLREYLTVTNQLKKSPLSMIEL